MAKSGSAALSFWLGAGILYLGAHALTGRQGLLAYVGLHAREQALESRMGELGAERAVLEARAARLRPETLDLDYLDERARVLLAAGARGEIVFALEP